MRGSPDLQMTMLTTVSTEAMVPADHPLRRIRTIVDAVLAEMDGDFEAMYSSIGRPSVPPETLLKSTVLMAMFSIRSERAFCQHLTYNLLKPAPARAARIRLVSPRLWPSATAQRHDSNQRYTSITAGIHSEAASGCGR
jgi:hypothetical protein